MISKLGLTANAFVVRDPEGSLVVLELDLDPREATRGNIEVVPELIVTFAEGLKRPLDLEFEGADAVAATFSPDGTWVVDSAQIREFVHSVSPE